MNDHKTKWLEQENERLKKQSNWMGGVIAVGIFLIVMFKAALVEGMYREFVLPLAGLGIIGYAIYTRRRRR